MIKNAISMVQGDFGVEYRLNIVNGTPSSEDSFLLIIKNTDGTEIIRKNYANVSTYIPFILTEEESGLLEAKNYYYIVDWYRNGIFLRNIVNNGMFKVKKKV